MGQRVAVIGGGAAGVSAALTALDGGASVTLFDPTGLGGKIAETSFDGLRIPTAADAFLARRPEALDLLERLGLSDRLVAPAAGKALIYRDGVCHPIPPSVLGIPGDIDALADGDLISEPGVERARQDLTAPDDRPEGDESVGNLVRRRLGDEVLEWMVDPLLGGINAGNSDLLSIRSGVPQIEALRNQGPSLLEAAGRTIARPTGDGPVFYSIRGGLSALFAAAKTEIETLGGRIVAVPVTGVTKTPNGFSLDGPSLNGLSIGGQDFDSVIAATPAAPTAQLLETVAPQTAELLDGIDYSSVAMMCLAVPNEAIPFDAEISGVLVPRLADKLVTAISFATRKWPWMGRNAGQDGWSLLRVSVGRRNDVRWLQMDDEELLASVLGDLADILGTDVQPMWSKITRWTESLPQYDVDHDRLVDQIESSAASEVPGLRLAGSWLRGLGIPACIGSGTNAARA